jgi:hypothetical protein
MQLLNCNMLSMIISMVLAIFVLQAVYRRVQYLISKRRHACHDPPKYPHKDPIWGLDLFFKTMNAFQNGNYLQTQTSLFEPYTSKTIKTHAFGTTIYRTYDPEVSKNFQSIFFKDFGIEPLRYHVAENLWGNGIVVSDGKKWADARSFIRSSFDVVHTANLDRLCHHVDKFMMLLPRDGSTVDLLPLFKRLVSPTSRLSIVTVPSLSQASDTGHL